MKKIAALILAITVVFSCIVTASAEEAPSTDTPGTVLSAGDVNADGKVDVNDAREILRAAIDMNDIPAACIPAADMDGDKDVTVSDARLSLRTAVSLEEEKSIGYTVTEFTPSSCTEDGSVTILSFVDEGVESITLVVPRSGHKLEEKSSTPATCTAEGEEISVCSVCGEEKNTTLRKLGHSFVLSATTAATCTAAGEKVNVCSVCGEKETISSPALGHSWAPATCTQPETCKVCSLTRGEARGHNPERADVFSPLKCTACGAVTSGEKASLTEYVDYFSDTVRYNKVYQYMDEITDIGARPYTTTAFYNAYSWIVDTLKAQGYSGSAIDTDGFYIGSTWVRNVIVTIPTKVSNPEVILFCAHYDSASIGRGAIDNGSGVCALLELARVAKELDVDFGYEIRFAFLAGEEVGFYGAYRYLNHYMDKTHAHITNIDMAGHSTVNTNWYLCVSTEPYSSSYGYHTAYANATSRCYDSAKDVLGNLGEDGYYTAITVGETDFIPFRRYGYTGANISWRQKGSSNADYNLVSPTTIHTTSDTFSMFDMNSLYQTTRFLAGALAAMVY